MPDSYAFEGWGNWPTWAVYLELSCDGSAWAKWVSVARRVRAEAAERPGLPADTAALGALSARLQSIINALGDAADRYGEPPDPDPEAQALAELLAEFKLGEPGILRWTEAGRALEHIGATFSVRPARCAPLAGPGLSAEEAYRAYLDAREDGQVCARVLVDDTPIPMDATGWVRSRWAHWSEESQELRQAEGEWPEPEEPQPPRAELLLWADEGWAYATDGCHVEPDGICPHGHPSWLLRLGLI